MKPTKSVRWEVEVGIQKKDLLGIKGYYCDSHGNIWFVKNNRITIRKSHPDKSGSLRIQIRKQNFSVADLVLEAFHGKKPHGFFACHNDGNKLNNNPNNLTWRTRIETHIPNGVFIDPEDLELIKKERWGIYLRKEGRYVVAKKTVEGKTVRILVHRLVMGDPKGVFIAHLNGNGLDCRKVNLSEASRHDNAHSYRRKSKHALSAFRGVRVRKKSRTNPYQVFFQDNGKKIYLGSFATEIEAAKIYDAEALRRYGKFAHLNFKNTELREVSQ